MSGREEGEGEGRRFGAKAQAQKKKELYTLLFGGKKKDKNHEVLIESVVLNWEEKILASDFFSWDLGSIEQNVMLLVVDLIFNFCL